MGFFLTILGKLMIPIAMTGAASVYAFRLGPELNVAARRAGQSFGMGYNYFKVILKFVTPESEQANKIISEFRRGSQQAHAILREVKFNTQQTADQFDKLIPGFTDGIDDPDKLREEQEAEKMKDAANKQPTGSQLVHNMY